MTLDVSAVQYGVFVVGDSRGCWWIVNVIRGRRSPIKDDSVGIGDRMQATIARIEATQLPYYTDMLGATSVVLVAQDLNRHAAMVEAMSLCESIL
jgi:hypothetical protein